MIKRALILLLMTPFVSGCMVGYLAESGYHQLGLLCDRVPIEEVLADPSVSEETKRKLRLSVEARQFAETELGLKKTDNYTSYVDLGRPYVSWVVRVADAYALQAHGWWFPLVGKVPYKGYFSEEAAVREARRYPADEYDTYVRGVAAYSTLGWFDDPVLSSMLRFEDHTLVNVIIHETVHATLYISGQAAFNEQLATFLGDQGAMRFYREREGPDSETVERIKAELHDREIFAAFIKAELKSLSEWYEDNTGGIGKPEKAARLQQIQDRFTEELAPRLLTENYLAFADLELNNAQLLSFRTYMADLDLFRNLLAHFDGDYGKMLAFCKTLEDADDPKEEMEKLLEKA